MQPISDLLTLQQPHGIMFHHFSDGKCRPGQGAITAQQLKQILIGLDINTIIPATEWLERHIAGTLAPGMRCLTFDDALMCQFEVALPVLEELGITGMFFVYTSHLQGDIPRLEVYRHFRSSQFAHAQDFYREFFKTVRGLMGSAPERRLASIPKSDLPYFPEFYSQDDRTFQIFRDLVLSKEEYEHVMDRMLSQYGVDSSGILRRVLLQGEHISELSRAGHVIGLHSHTHPMNLGSLPRERQEWEYEMCCHSIARLTGRKPIAMSHPSNSYSPVTLDVLKSLGIKVGFRADTEKLVDDPLEVPRLDHTHCRIVLGV